MSQGWQKHFSFGQGKCSAGDSQAVQGLKSSRLSTQGAEDFDGSMMDVKHATAL